MELNQDPRPALKLVHETHPLPTNRSHLVKRISEILARGGVQRLVIGVGQDIVVSRLVERSPDEPPAESGLSDLMALIRNVPLETFYCTEKAPIRVLTKAMCAIGRKKLSPVAIVVHRTKDFKDYIGCLDPDLDEMFGIPIVADPEMPDDSVLVPASTSLEPDSVTFCLRVEIEKEVVS